MSRNVRHKSNATPTKKPARITRPAGGDSSSDDYEGVDDISDSDEEEKDVEKAEFQALINDLSDDDLETTPRPPQDDDEVSYDGSVDDQLSWNGFDGDQDVLGDNLPFFEEHMARAEPSAEATLYPSDDEPGPRRVRFALAEDLSDSSSTISDDSNHGFPDLFVDQNELDPYFRREVENDADEDRGSSDGGFWDFENPGRSVIGIDGSSDDGESSSGTDESGYSTDEDGETTEEEDLPPRFIAARSVLRQPASEPTSEEEEIVIRRASPKTPRTQARGPPRLGTWSHTPERPFAMIDPKTKRMVMFKAKAAKVARRFSFNDAPRLPTLFETESGFQVGSGTTQDMSPMISNSANLMMSAMYGSNLDIFGGQVLGPPEAFFPFTSIDANGQMSRDSSDSFDDDDIDENEFQILEMDDLIDFGDEADEDETDTSPTDGETGLTPRPTTATSEDQVHPLLMSQPGLVGAFRRHQNDHRILSGSNASQNSLLFSGRFNSTAIQGIREGHIGAAGTPITPLRKQKKAPMPMDSSPLAGKRKFSGEQHGHKRNRSMN